MFAIHSLLDAHDIPVWVGLVELEGCFTHFTEKETEAQRADQGWSPSLEAVAQKGQVPRSRYPHLDLIQAGQRRGGHPGAAEPWQTNLEPPESQTLSSPPDCKLLENCAHLVLRHI